MSFVGTRQQTVGPQAKLRKSEYCNILQCVNKFGLIIHFDLFYCCDNFKHEPEKKQSLRTNQNLSWNKSVFYYFIVIISIV